MILSFHVAVLLLSITRDVTSGPVRLSNGLHVLSSPAVAAADRRLPSTDDILADDHDFLLASAAADSQLDHSSTQQAVSDIDLRQNRPRDDVEGVDEGELVDWYHSPVALTSSAGGYDKNMIIVPDAVSIAELQSRDVSRPVYRRLKHMSTGRRDRNDVTRTRPSRVSWPRLTLIDRPTPAIDVQRRMSSSVSAPSLQSLLQPDIRRRRRLTSSGHEVVDRFGCSSIFSNFQLPRVNCVQQLDPADVMLATKRTAKATSGALTRRGNAVSPAGGINVSQLVELLNSFHSSTLGGSRSAGHDVDGLPPLQSLRFG